MVFLSLCNFVTRTGYDKMLKHQKIFKLTAKYFGRRRNCYSIAMKFVSKALRYTTVSRKIKPQYLYQLRQTRIDAACAEHNIDYFTLKSNLVKCNIMLDGNVLKDIAIWEPRTFKCLTDIAQTKHKLEAPKEVSERLKSPDGTVITRGML
ncbi:39S ribosomal protein L20, mitochondrial-like [Uloborus diversus]|uniref:39S ribosomal protein L20, mitochondrial-like n=1 Tax=Uloborus diversus TaxID=327109 RepID=UPI0024095DAA|nr:39S ribosomal protein L20, mitochondrial-like [Uloborus diversus]